MAREEATERYGRSLIKNHPHASLDLHGRSRDGQAPFGMPQHKLDLFARNARKPCEKIVNPRAALKILKQRDDRNTRAFEHPRTADPFGRAFNCRTLCPIKHDSVLGNPRYASNRDCSNIIAKLQMTP